MTPAQWAICKRHQMKPDDSHMHESRCNNPQDHVRSAVTAQTCLMQLASAPAHLLLL
jgi:hypothetical protein